MFKNTLKEDYFKNVIGYEKASVNKGENYFDIERFVFRDDNTAFRLEKVLEKNKHNRLAVKSNTFYCYFREHNNIVLMITPGSWKSENCSLLNKLQKKFLSPEVVQEKPK